MKYKINLYEQNVMKTKQKLFKNKEIYTYNQRKVQFVSICYQLRKNTTKIAKLCSIMHLSVKTTVSQRMKTFQLQNVLINNYFARDILLTFKQLHFHFKYFHSLAAIVCSQII